MPLEAVYVTAIVSVVTHSQKWHDKISDIFGIRSHFDTYEILLPLAFLSNSDPIDIQRMRREREDSYIMYDVFYEYASQYKDDCEIPYHFVTEALDNWCWYWISLELLSISVFAFIIAAAYDASGITYTFSALIALLSILAFRNRRVGTTKAYREVRAIADDDERSREIRERFDEIRD